jgi:hypothetical protein
MSTENVTQRRKWFRFSVKAMLASIALIAASLWWIQWPTNVARAFVAAPSAYPSIHACTDPEADISIEEFVEYCEGNDQDRLVPIPRNMMELLTGEQTFLYGHIEFTVVRGQIPDGPKNSAVLYVRRFGSFGSAGGF